VGKLLPRFEVRTMLITGFLGPIVSLVGALTKVGDGYSYQAAKLSDI
jgi:hypothetical protein